MRRQSTALRSAGRLRCASLHGGACLTADRQLRARTAPGAVISQSGFGMPCKAPSSACSRAPVQHACTDMQAPGVGGPGRLRMPSS